MQVQLYTVIEFYGRGDPFFGGNASDRPLGRDGRFIEGSYLRSEVARFETEGAARTAGEAAPNRRQGGLISAFPSLFVD